MHGCSGEHAWLLWSVCVVALGGAWLLWGACVVAPGGTCVVAPGGHAWLLQGGMHGCSRGACMVKGGRDSEREKIRHFLYVAMCQH